MNRKVVLDQITALVLKFRAEIETNNKLNLTDINIHAENFLIPLLKIVYGWNLRNTNMYSMNSPAIDLEDEESGIAIQVTSTGTSAKVKKTLVKYKTHHGVGKHSQLIILILTKKQKKYSSEDIINHANDIAAFDLDKNIIDFEDIIREIHGLHNLNKIKEVLDLLQTELSDPKIEVRKNVLKGIIEDTFETYQTNLVRVSVPPKIYEYRTKIDRSEVIRKSWKTKWKLKSRASNMEVFQRAVRFLEERIIPPYYQYGNHLYTFKNIQNSKLYSLCAPGSETVYETNQFSATDISHERTVVALLKRTLISDLRVKRIAFKYSEGVFFFEKDEGEDNRSISYVLEKSASRNVVTPMYVDEDGIPGAYKHLSFWAFFIKSNNEWFMSIRPTWMFTKDGYQLSIHNSSQISDQKRLENNQHVNNAFEFIRFCLNNRVDVDKNSHHQPILTFQAIQPITVKL